jgi:hypothetical protein
MRNMEKKRRAEAEAIRKAEELAALERSKGLGGLVSALVKVSRKAGGVVLVLGGAYFAGAKIFEILQERRQRPKSLPTIDTKSRAIPITSSMSNEELLNGTKRVVVDQTSIDDPVKKGKPVVLLFDCEEKLSSAADVTARKEYFSLMANLTNNGQDFTTVYVPASSNSNPHLIERNATFRPDWRYISSTSEGRQYSSALRTKFEIKGEELRIMVLSPELEVVSENALELLRVAPYSMPWTPMGVRRVLGSTFLSPDLPVDQPPVTEEFDDKVIGLYFSASWCKPCQVCCYILS